MNLFVQPPIPTATEFSDIPTVRAIIQRLDQGEFRQPALLVERMLWNPRLRAVVETRLAGFAAAEVRFKPSGKSRHHRRSAKEFKKDWPLIAPSPMRKQMLKWALMLGVSFGQRPTDVSTEGRTIYKLRPYWPGFASWYWSTASYRIQTFDRGVASVRTPTVDRAPNLETFAPSPIVAGAASPEKSPWLIVEPYGMNSYREALVHAAFRPWMGHEFSMRDQARSSEKHGVGGVIAEFPRGSGDEYDASLAKFLNGLRSIGSEFVFPCQLGENAGDPGFGVKPFEYNGTGFQAISDTMNSNAVALAILFLGHNLTTEIKGGGSYAAASVGDYIRDDKKRDDASTEWDYVEPQLARPWAMANYGDPSLAPIAEYVTDSPAVNLHRAQMIFNVAQAIAQLRANLPRANLVALAEEFDLPMLDEGAVVQVPAAADAPPAPPANDPPPPTPEKGTP